MPTPHVTRPTTLAVASAFAETLVIPTQGADFLTFEISNTGATLLNHFKIERQITVGGDWLPWLSDDDFLVPTVVMPEISSVVPKTLAAGGKTWFTVRPNAAQIRFSASTGGAATTLTISNNGYSA